MLRKYLHLTIISVVAAAAHQAGSKKKATGGSPSQAIARPKCKQSTAVYFLLLQVCNCFAICGGGVRAATLNHVL